MRLSSFQLVSWSRPFVLFAVVAAADLQTLPLRADESATNDSAAAIPDEQIDQWVVQLDDDRFDRRQRAQRQLENAGKPALEAVAKAAQVGSLESSTRAVNVLVQWSESNEQVLRLAALEAMAQLPNRPRESAMATRLLAEGRERAALAEITKLGAKVSDMHFGGIANRQILLDQRWKGGDDGLKHLVEVRHVAIVKLHGAEVTDAGLDHLALLPEVRKIELFGIKASKAGIKKLESQLPPGVVDPRSGALLGVKGDIGGDVRVAEVVPDSAAHKAGIRQDDRILELNGEAVKDFEALTRRIAEYQPGDTVTFTIERNGESRKVKATFDRWGANEAISNHTQRLNRIQIRRAVPANQIIVPPRKTKKAIPRSPRAIPAE